MIAFVRGTAVDMTENSVIVETGGIGYEIYMTGTDLSQIHMGEEVKIQWSRSESCCGCSGRNYGG